MAYLDAAGWVQRGDNGQSIVALGGGHGLSATLRALRHITRQLTAVVTVADDGGSSGRLRSCPPATCAWPWRACARSPNGA